MGQMLRAYLGFDVALRCYFNRSGNTAAGRELAKAGAELRRIVAAQVLAEARTDPKADLEAVLLAAINAGVSWQDMAAMVNTIHQRNPGGF